MLFWQLHLQEGLYEVELDVSDRIKVLGCVFFVLLYAVLFNKIIVLCVASGTFVGTSFLSINPPDE